MPELVTESGAANANSYADLAWYKGYLSTRLPAVPWLARALAGEIDEQLTVDLIASGRLIDTIEWSGEPATETQAMVWPRIGMLNRNGVVIGEDEIPTDLKDAQSELAIQARLTDLLSEDEAAKKGVKRVKAGSLEVEFQTKSGGESEFDILTRRLSPELSWLRIPQAVRDLLVPSWYIREVVIEKPKPRGFLFTH